MKKRILLIDESLTVQKVVALTLDRNVYSVNYAKTRTEAIKWIGENPPDLILVSDQVAEIQTAAFPKEVEAWMGRNRIVPPVVLITGQDLKESRHYAGVLRKPFAPQTLQELVMRLTKAAEESARMSESEGEAGTPDEFEDQRLQKMFNETFADESKLVTETLSADAEAHAHPPSPPPSPHPEEKRTFGESGSENWNAPKVTLAPPPPKAAPAMRVPTPADLWSLAAPVVAANAPSTPSAKSPVLGAEDSMAYKAVLESRVHTELGKKDLDEIVERYLSKVVPPIVERMVQEKLDKLLKDQEQFVELKP